MSTSIIQGDLHLNGSLSCDSFNAPAGCMDNDAVLAGANIDAAKLTNRHVYKYIIDGTVADTDPVIHIAHCDGALVAMHVAILTHPTTTDTVVLDLKKSTGLGAFASVLTSTVTLDSSTVDKTVYDAVITTNDYIADDLFQLDVNATGTSGANMIVTVIFDEEGV